MEQNNASQKSESTVRLRVDDIVYPKWASQYEDNLLTEGFIDVEEYTGQSIIDVIYSAISMQLSLNPKGCLVTGTFEGKEYQSEFINLSDCCADDDEE